MQLMLLAVFLLLGPIGHLVAQEEDEDAGGDPPHWYYEITVVQVAEEIEVEGGDYHWVPDFEGSGHYGNEQDEVPGESGSGGGGNSTRPTARSEAECVRSKFCESVRGNLLSVHQSPQEAHRLFSTATQTCDPSREIALIHTYHHTCGTVCNSPENEGQQSFSYTFTVDGKTWAMACPSEGGSDGSGGTDGGSGGDSELQDPVAGDDCVLENDQPGVFCGETCREICPLGTERDFSTCACLPLGQLEDGETSGCLLADGSVGWMCSGQCQELCSVGTRANSSTCLCEAWVPEEGDICGFADNGQPKISCGGECYDPCPVGFWRNPDNCFCDERFDPFGYCERHCRGLLELHCPLAPPEPPFGLIETVANDLVCETAAVWTGWQEMMGSNCTRARALCAQGFPGSCWDWAEGWRLGDPTSWQTNIFNGFYTESPEHLRAWVLSQGLCHDSSPPPQGPGSYSLPQVVTALPLKSSASDVFEISWDYPAVASVDVEGYGSFPGGSGSIQVPTTQPLTLRFTVHSAPELGLPPVRYDAKLTPMDPSDHLVATPQTVAAGQPVTLEWHLPGASSVTMVGLGSFSGDRGSLVVHPTTSSTYSVYGHYRPFHETRLVTRAVEVVGSGSAPEHFGTCQDPCSTSVVVPGFTDLHYCRHIASPDGRGGNETARWIRVSDFESLVGTPEQPLSSYCFEASCGDGSLAPFRFHSPGTAPALWVLPSAVPAEVCGDGFDNDCDGIIDDGCPVCTDGERRCLGDSAQTCVNGQWGATEACTWGCDTSRNACYTEDPACIGRPSPCNHEGARFCSSIQESVVSCVRNAQGCLQWQVTEHCTNGCHLGVCEPDPPACPWGSGSCSILGEKRCTSAAGYRSCAQDTDGCLRWTPKDSGQCNEAAGEVCHSGTCAVVACSSNIDCAGSTRFCDAGTCARCTSDSECGGSAYTCSSDGRCKTAF